MYAHRILIEAVNLIEKAKEMFYFAVLTYNGGIYI